MATPYQIVNEVQSTLASAWTRGTSTAIVLDDGVLFPSGGGYVRIGDASSFALMIYTGKTGDDQLDHAADGYCTLGLVVSVGDEAKEWPIGTVVSRVWMAEEAAQLITGPASATDGNLFAADGTTGKKAKDAGVSLGAGTSGGVPYYSAAAVLGSSAALTANAVVVGGGAGATPATISAATTTTHALFATAGAPAFRAIAAGDLPDIPLTGLADQAAATILANNTTGAAAPTAVTSDAFQNLRIYQLGKAIYQCFIESLDGWTLAAVGTGSYNNWGFGRIDLHTGGTTGGEERLYSGTTAYYVPAGSGVQRIFLFTGWGGTDRTTCTVLAGLWDESGFSVPCTLTQRHYGWKVINGAIYATNGDGSTEKATDTGVTYDVAWRQHLLEMRFVPSTSVAYYVDGVLKATHTDNVPVAINPRTYASIVNSANAERAFIFCGFLFEFGE